MSVYKVDTQLPLSTRINTINDMVIEVNGKTVQGQFDKKELDQLYTDYDFNRKFLRNQSLGHSLTDYTDWSHYYAESGYSIWKITPTRYKYNSNNCVYMDDRALTFRGNAEAENTTFDAVYNYLSSSYVDKTAVAASGLSTISLPSVASTEFHYIGASSVFSGVDYTFTTNGNNYTLVVEYWNGSTWVTMSSLVNQLTDDTSNWNTDGRITWTIPLTWAKTTVNGGNYYFVRISTSTTPVTVAVAKMIKPNSGIRSLLSLTSSNITNEAWAWCSYNGSIYVTIRNVSVAAYEGNYFITSASSAANLQNYFISNHAFKADYEDSAYGSGSGIHVESGVTYGDLVYVSDEYTFDAADADSFAKRCMGILTSAGYVKLTNGLVKNVNTVGSGNIVPGDVLYLSTNAGKVSRVAPATGGGKIQQRVGIAISYENSGSVVDMIFRPEYV